MTGRGFEVKPSGFDYAFNSPAGNIKISLFQADDDSYALSGSSTDMTGENYKTDKKDFSSKTLAGLDKQIADALKWIDGKLARWLNQRSDFGARLDSLADSVLYAALFCGIAWIRWDVLRSETLWWCAAFLSYVMTTSAGLWKYGKVPSYHTYGAKTSQWLILAGAVCLLLDYSIWPFRIAMAGVTLTNVEAMAITWAGPLRPGGWPARAWRASLRCPPVRSKRHERCAGVQQQAWRRYGNSS